MNVSKVRAAGCSTEELKAIFTNIDDEKNSEAKKLVECMRSEVKAGIDRNIKDYRIYWAIDRAFDAPFYQVSYTQLQGLLDSKTRDDKEVLNQVKTWGLTHMLPDVIDPTTGKACCNADGSTKKGLNLPVFFHIFVPLVCAYITIRWAKLFNDRNIFPLYKYEPAKFSKNNRVRCEIITELIQLMSVNFDYSSDERQAILQTLLYGVCIKFPREAWYKVEQLDTKGKEKIVKEGVRFNMPHPARMYWDLFNRASTINTDTGVRHMGYWSIEPYKDIKNNKALWNQDKIPFGVNSWFNSAPDFFSTVYPCILTFPTSSPSSGMGAGQLDREAEATYYTSTEEDKATLVTHHFKRLIPKDWGLGTYKYPVWFRFMLANDGAVTWAEPLAFTPGVYYGYDADQNRARNKSLALEVLPHQDLVSQVMSQWVLSTKQNLINPVFFNSDLVGQEIVDALENMGQRMYSTRAFIPFSKTENVRLGEDEKEAFHSPQFTRHDTAQLAMLVKGVLDILDRVLVLSSQEIGQSAPHEQTAEEVRVISHTTSTRLDFTGGFIDDGIYATKKLLYDALIAYGHEEFNVSISQNYGTKEEFEKLVDDLDLELVDESDADSVDGKVSVTGKKESLEMEAFASKRDGANRIDNTAVGAAMAQIFQAVAGNPLLIQAVGPQQLVELLNQVISVSGLPKEFKLRLIGKVTMPQDQQNQQAQADQANQLKEQLLGFAEQIKKAIGQSAEQTEQKVLAETVKMVEPIAQAVKATDQRDQQQEAVIAQLAQAIKQIEMVIQAAANRPAIQPQLSPMPTNELPANLPPPGPADALAGTPV